jgi:hypothetical protein
MTHWKNTRSERVEQGRNCIPESGCLRHLALRMSRKISWVTCCTLPTFVSCTSKVIGTTACKCSHYLVEHCRVGETSTSKTLDWPLRAQAQGLHQHTVLPTSSHLYIVRMHYHLSLPWLPLCRCTNGCGNSLVGGWHKGWVTPMMLWYQPKLMLWLFYQ